MDELAILRTALERIVALDEKRDCGYDFAVAFGKCQEIAEKALKDADDVAPELESF